MKYLRNFIPFYLVCICSTASATITPLIINSEFHNDSWFPLPIEQMESAAVDTALTRLSETGKFAFIYKPDATLAKKSGSLDLTVSLIEPAESAKITMRLSYPDNQGSYVSSSSISLSNKDFNGIFNALQQMGENAADQLNFALEASAVAEKVDNKEQVIRDQIIKLNLNIIKLDNSVSVMQQNNRNAALMRGNDHNAAVMQKLGQIDILIAKVDSHHEYVKQSDIEIKEKLDMQSEYANRANVDINRKLDSLHEGEKNSNRETNRKLNEIYSEVSKLNIGSNTDNSPLTGDELTKYDVSQLIKLTRAREFKFDKKFDKARLVLTGVRSDYNISSVFRKAVNEELNINLPLYEAEIIINEVTTLFMNYLKNDEYKLKIKYANKLYDNVLSQQDLSFKKRVEVNQKKDQLNLTGESMNTAATALRSSSLGMLSHALRDAMYRHQASRAMGIEATPGPCPSRDKVNVKIRQSKVNSPVVSYGMHDKSCELILEESSDHLLVFIFNQEESSYVRKKR